MHSLAARWARDRDTARAERDAASSERDARAQERDEGAKEFAAELERCKASAKEAAAQAEQKRLALAKQLKDVTESRDWVYKENDRMTNDLDDLQGKFNDLREKYKGAAAELERCKASAKEAADQAEQKYDALATIRQDLQEKYKKCKKQCDDWKEHSDFLDKFNDDLNEKLAEAREQCKTARELGRREAEADMAAAKARADNAVKSLQAELAKSKSLEDELELVKAQRDTAKLRLGQVAHFQRKQVEMQRMLMSQSFMNLEDGAAASPSAGPSVTMGSVIDGPSPVDSLPTGAELLQALNSSEVESCGLSRP